MLKNSKEYGFLLRFQQKATQLWMAFLIKISFVK